MTNRPFFALCLLSILTLFFGYSCQKSEPIVFTPETKVTIQTIHHDVIVPECEVYVQYHADRNEFPGFENFAGFDTLHYTDDDGRAILENLPLGTHWLYGRGYDDQIMTGVKGVLKIKLSLREPTIDTILYVGEE
ncbi:MAG: hypothetical protein AB8G22_26555 [Saprospiraceae bacterium]